MTYKKLYEEFVSFFSENIDDLNRIADTNGVDDTDGMHVIFGMVVVPFIIELLENKDTEKIKKAFFFLEKMAVSDDLMICEVLEFTVLEDFISLGKDFLEKCKRNMGKETLGICQVIENNMFC